MRQLKWCSLFFVFFFFSSYFLYAQTQHELEPIVVKKHKAHLLNFYTINSNQLSQPFFALPFVDLQARSPKGGIQTDFSLRGSNFQGVLLLLDGQRINDPQTAHFNSDIPITSEDIEQIEIIPGGASSVLGPDAIGGALNFILKKPQDKNRTFELKGGRYSMSSGSFSISEGNNNKGFRLSLENDESEGFYLDTDYKKFTASTDSFIGLPDGEFRLNLGYQEKEFGAYDFYTPQKGYQSKEWTKTYLLKSSLDLEKNTIIIKPSFLWRRHLDKFLLDKTLARSTYLNHHRTDTYTPRIYLQKEMSSLGKVGVGFEYSKESIKSTNLGNHSRNYKGMFIDEVNDLSTKVGLGLSLRIDDFGDYEEFFSGQISLNYNFLPKNTLHFGISRSARMPSFTELYYSDPTTLGNSNLVCEKSIAYQIGYSYKEDAFLSGITFFLRDEDDTIDWIKHSLTQDKWQAENITTNKVFGIEQNLGLVLGEYANLKTNYTYINKEQDKKGYFYKYGPNYVRHLFNATFSYEFPFGTQSIGATYKKKPLRSGWWIVNICFNYRLNNSLTLFLKASNILNVEYQEIEGIPQPGIWPEAGFRLEW